MRWGWLRRAGRVTIGGFIALRARRFAAVQTMLRSVLRFFFRFWPSSLRLQLMIVLLPVVGLPIIATGYMLKLRGHEAIVEEKQVHLAGVGDLLAAHLAAQGGYAGLLAGYAGAPDDRAAQLAFLNERLRPYTDEVARAFPEVGVGFFHRGIFPGEDCFFPQQGLDQLVELSTIFDDDRLVAGMGF